MKLEVLIESLSRNKRDALKLRIFQGHISDEKFIQ